MFIFYVKNMEMDVDYKVMATVIAANKADAMTIILSKLRAKIPLEAIHIGGSIAPFKGITRIIHMNISL